MGCWRDCSMAHHAGYGDLHAPGPQACGLDPPARHAMLRAQGQCGSHLRMLRNRSAWPGARCPVPGARPVAPGRTASTVSQGVIEQAGGWTMGSDARPGASAFGVVEGGCGAALSRAPARSRCLLSNCTQTCADAGAAGRIGPASRLKRPPEAGGRTRRHHEPPERNCRRRRDAAADGRRRLAGGAGPVRRTCAGRTGWPTGSLRCAMAKAASRCATARSWAPRCGSAGGRTTPPSAW